MRVDGREIVKGISTEIFEKIKNTGKEIIISSQKTLSAVQPPVRFRSLNIKKNKITSFEEKPLGDGSWINGGYFVLEPNIFDHIENDQTIWERESLEKLAKDSQLLVDKHNGYWNAVDMLRDKNHMEDLWNNK